MLEPFGFRVIIKPDVVSEEIGGTGLIRPQTNIAREQGGIRTGILVKKGPDVEYGLENVPEGSSVVIKRYAGSLIENPYDGIEYMIVNDEDVVAWDNKETG